MTMLGMGSTGATRNREVIGPGSRVRSRRSGWTYPDVLATVVAVCTFALVAHVFLGRGPDETTQDQPFGAAPSRIADWTQASVGGHSRGSDSASVTIVVFSDFECPACRQFAHEVIPSLDSSLVEHIRLVYRHWPLRTHRLALVAARASECAAARGVFWPFHDKLFPYQRELGVRPFRAIAGEVGITDLDAFDACVADERGDQRPLADASVARTLGGRGTPTVLVNGWLFRDGIDGITLDSTVRSLLTDGRLER
jgi:predicted DsbA family dithiol-disulfide isomerase